MVAVHACVGHHCRSIVHGQQWSVGPRQSADRQRAAVPQLRGSPRRDVTATGRDVTRPSALGGHVPGEMAHGREALAATGGL